MDESEMFLRRLPVEVQGAAVQATPDAEAAEADTIEVVIGIAITMRRHKFKGGRAKGRVVWQAEGARIVSAGGEPYVEPDPWDNSPGAWINKPIAD